MGLFGRLLGKEHPKVPAGGRAFVVMESGQWCVRVDTGTPPNKRISPTFDLQTSAYAYLDWINGGPAFKYPEGKA